MSDAIRVYFIGTAGSGKSTLTQAFKLWMSEHGLNSITVNLDPGVEELGYDPDVDIRDWVSVSEVMAEQGLGPNGAQIACADMAALHFPEISKVIEEFRADYILMDTPGQVELFVFREASSIFVNAFTTGHGILIFVLDPSIARTPTGLVSLLMLSTSVQFRFDTPLQLILGKADLLEDEEIRTIIDWCENPPLLMDEIGREGMDMKAIAAGEFLKAMETLGTQAKPVAVSSIEITGIEDIYNLIQQTYFGGEDLRPD